MKTARLVPLALFVLVLFSIAPASASLILYVDAATKEVYFSGSDTGTANPTAGADFIFPWNSGTGTVYSQIILDPSALEVSVLSLNKHRLEIMTGESGKITAFFALPDDPNGPFTVTGTGTRSSYATLDAPHQTLLEGFAGPLTSLTTFSDMQIQHTSAVPEPSTYALLCISLGVVGYARRKLKMEN